MATVESVEYYSACPQCGAANVGLEKCDYCGASLIKRKTNTEFRSEMSDEETENLRQDADYPEVRGKLYEPDPFLLMFCPIFGGIFLLVPTIILLAFSSVGIMESWLYLMLGLFWLIGIGGISPLIVSLYKNVKCKNGNLITGIVRGYEESMVLVNGKPMLYVRLLVNERTDPKILILNTGKSAKVYPIGKVMKLRGYNNNFIIEKEKL
ncbi:MAG: hypothetical protein Q4D29_03440 [Lachnospiraceae bacterium]|nr:hypothetical protein [Lachnospiraceae bacterium]